MQTYKLGDIVEVNALGEPESAGLILMVIAPLAKDLYFLASENNLYWFREFNLNLISESTFDEVKTMCTECNQSPCATMCPNVEPVLDDDIMLDCALCGKEVDEAETRYGICEGCWEKHSDYDNALAYGNDHRQTTSINGLHAKLLTPDQIENALALAVRDMKAFYPDFTIKTALEFLAEDDGNFADWLKRRASDD